MKESILKNIQKIIHRVETACAHSNRNPNEVKLLLATKTVTADNIKIALQAGQTLIGENKVQEIKTKYDALRDVAHKTHFIGHLQTNKIKDILKYDVSCIQSLDRFDLADKLHRRLIHEKRKIDVFIQVNTSEEESKFGVYPDKAIELVRQVSELSSLKIKGLMTIGIFSSDETKVRNCFKLLKKIQEKIIEENIPGVNVDQLSMGMSGDLEIAIEEGATMLRVGTAIFGKRIYPDSYYWDESKN